MNFVRLLAGCLFALALCVGFAPARAGQWPAPYPSLSDAKIHAGLSNLEHLIFIVQENRSFDSYFGTYPHALGFPSPLPCLPDLYHPSQCDTPYPDHNSSNQGGPVAYKNQLADIDNGKMDGFVIEAEKGCKPPKCTVDVLGYHDRKDIPNYWAYAGHYVLMDHFFESVASWDLPSHLALFSLWSAECAKLSPPDVDSCHASLGGQVWDQRRPLAYLWTDVTYMLSQNNISWDIYNDGGIDPPNDPFRLSGVQLIWNVLPAFQTVQEDGQVASAEANLTQFYVDVQQGTLPQVSWILPDYADSEHPHASIVKGQSYVTNLVNAVMSGPDWNSSAIFIVWDDMGGFYDGLPPIRIDDEGLGVRVPSLLISPYAKRGYIDRQICSTDCYVKFIEDVFLNGERMKQAGRPDPRHGYRDEAAQYGDLENDFNFHQSPLPPLLLSTHPMTMLRENSRP